jgi:hypothetical protein
VPSAAEAEAEEAERAEHDARAERRQELAEMLVDEVCVCAPESRVGKPSDAGWERRQELAEMLVDEVCVCAPESRSACLHWKPKPKPCAHP